MLNGPPQFPSQPGAGAELTRLAGFAAAALDSRRGPAPAATVEDMRAWARSIDVCPSQAHPASEVFAELVGPVAARSVDPSHPWCAAHLHCAPLLPAVAAELVTGVLNQSMDSYDQAPVATELEDTLMRWLAGEAGLPNGTGVMTAGGTASNLLALTLARAAAAAAAGGDVRRDGLPAGWERWRIVTSSDAHFSVVRAAAQLGLGAARVVTVAPDDRGVLRGDAVQAELDRLRETGLVPIAVVATAGTTDRGAVDDLAEVGALARAAGAWFHVDAAVGSAFLLSERLRPRIAGIRLADSVTADFHKLWFLPISASALIVRDPSVFSGLDVHHDYLDREEDAEAGVLNLVSRSLDTTRRFDALKVLVALRTLGRSQYGALVEHCVDLAAAAGAAVERRAELELLAPPATVTVLFRCRPPGAPPHELDALNTALARALLAEGTAVIGRTRHRGAVALKLTLVNPTATADDVERLLDHLVARASRLRWPVAERPGSVRQLGHGDARRPPQ